MEIEALALNNGVAGQQPAPVHGRTGSFVSFGSLRSFTRPVRAQSARKASSTAPGGRDLGWGSRAGAGNRRLVGAPTAAGLIRMPEKQEIARGLRTAAVPGPQQHEGAVAVVHQNFIDLEPALIQPRDQQPVADDLAPRGPQAVPGRMDFVHILEIADLQHGHGIVFVGEKRALDSAVAKKSPVTVRRRDLPSDELAEVEDRERGLERRIGFVTIAGKAPEPQQRANAHAEQHEPQRQHVPEMGGHGRPKAEHGSGHHLDRQAVISGKIADPVGGPGTGQPQNAEQRHHGAGHPPAGGDPRHAPGKHHGADDRQRVNGMPPSGTIQQRADDGADQEPAVAAAAPDAQPRP